MLSRLLLSALLFVPLCYGQSVNVKTPVNIYYYHDMPPYVTDFNRNQGLYFDYVNCFNKYSNDYSFVENYIPKSRILRMIDNKKLDGIVLGVNPIWFSDPKKKKYLWSQVISVDQDEFVSLKSTPFDYENEQSFKGKIVGGVRGFYYKEIDELLAQEKLIRVDTINEKMLLRMLLSKRVDLAIVSRATMIHYFRVGLFKQQFHLSTIPHDTYTRHVMLPTNQKALLIHLNQLLDAHCSF